MPDQIKIPGLGEVPKKTALIAGAAAVGIIAVVAIRHKSSSGAATSSTATGATPPDPNAIDPTTGVPYSQEGGANVAGYSSGYQIPYGTGGGGYGAGGSGFDAAGYPIGSEADLAWQNIQNGTGGTGGGVTGITTNAEWVTEAESGVIPGSVSTIAAAISKVLGGLAVTSAQRDLFLEAVGVLGNPPQGYPQPIKLKDTPAHPGGGDKHKVIEASGNETLSDIAHDHHTMGGVLVTLNPYLSKYYGHKTHVPRGSRIKVP